jgi:hypothetical protein
VAEIETLRDALFGNPPSTAHEPSREGLLSAFTELKITTEAGIAAAALSGTDLDAAMELVEPLLESANDAAQSSAQSAASAAAALGQAQAAVYSIPVLIDGELSGAINEVAALSEESTTARDQSVAAASQAANSFSSIDALDNMYSSQAAGEAAVMNGYFTFVDGGGNIVYVRRVAGVSTIITPGAFATLTGNQTITGIKTFEGIVNFATNADRIGVTSAATPLTPEALFHIRNEGSLTNGLRVQSYWTGTTVEPYTNNDTILVETFSSTVSDSANRSWGISVPNYSLLNAGIHDSGEFVSVYGWSVGLADHKGRVTTKVGVRGGAGFRGTGAPATAQIDLAIGVDGQVFAEAVGATIVNGRAGNFITTITPSTGIVQNNFAVYAEASGGTEANWSWFSPAGDMFQRGRAFFGEGSFSEDLDAQSVADINARGGSPNAFGFGSGDLGGFGSHIGATAASGQPFYSWFCEADPTGNTFRTRGKAGNIMRGDGAGAVIFSRAPSTSASGQAPSDDVIWRPNGSWLFLKRPRLFGTPPASASAPGEQWEIAVDAGHFYVCIADNTWVRVALASW